MSILDRKLLRDLSQLRGQVVTICLVVASGIAAYVAMQSAYKSLYQSRDEYYQNYRFPDIFAQAQRVPDAIEAHLRAVPGVALAHTRITENIRVPLPDQDRVLSGRIVSLPAHGSSPLSDVYISQGRAPEPAHHNEALLLESFAEVHDVHVGDRVPLILNGILRHVVITGLAMNPEYVFAFGGDVLSYEPGGFAVVWMRRDSIAPAFDMAGAFNDVVFRLEPGASESKVLTEVDRVLKPYGGFGAQGRDRQPSHHFLKSELDGLRVQATIVPLIFLAVAAFLVNVVLSRIVELQRGIIATLKAVGYSNRAVAAHFLKLVSLIVLLGATLGIAGGSWMAQGMLTLYTPYFRFPSLQLQLGADILLTAVFISLSSAILGAALALKKVIALTPAEAMRPAAPPSYAASGSDRWLRYLVGPVGRMVLRELRRRPLRLLVSSVGISLAVAILIIGRFATDSINHLLELQFGRSMGEDLALAFNKPVPARATRQLETLPGVTHSEVIRTVPVRLRAGALSRDTVIQTVPDPGRLRVILNREGHPVSPPLGGVVLTDVLAERLGVKPGDEVTAELLEGSREDKRLLIAGTVSDMLGMQGYMRATEVQAWLGEPPLASMVLLSVDADQIEAVKRRLYSLPSVTGISEPALAMSNFRKQQGGTMLAMTAILTFFAVVISVGIVYNNARVTLSSRSRDLASMRVLGFTRGEISTVLMGELAFQVVLALPLGMWLGGVASNALLSADPENFRMPAVISLSTYTFAALITVGSAMLSGLLVRRKLDSLNLIEVLKTRD